MAGKGADELGEVASVVQRSQQTLCTLQALADGRVLLVVRPGIQRGPEEQAARLLDEEVGLHALQLLHGHLGIVEVQEAGFLHVDELPADVKAPVDSTRPQGSDGGGRARGTECRHESLVHVCKRPHRVVSDAEWGHVENARGARLYALLPEPRGNISLHWTVGGDNLAADRRLTLPFAEHVGVQRGVGGWLCFDTHPVCRGNRRGR